MFDPQSVGVGVMWGFSGGMVVDNVKINPKGTHRQSADLRGFRINISMRTPHDGNQRTTNDYNLAPIDFLHFCITR